MCIRDSYNANWILEWTKGCDETNTNVRYVHFPAVSELGYEQSFAKNPKYGPLVRSPVWRPLFVDADPAPMIPFIVWWIFWERSCQRIPNIVVSQVQSIDAHPSTLTASIEYSRIKCYWRSNPCERSLKTCIGVSISWLKQKWQNRYYTYPGALYHVAPLK